ncbi:MAG: HAD family phosphatase [Candidatus Margulisbacteria bacterium]|nr:HAD family phosphatase [Candidatus Margulisiibacteriota bacterium]
MSQKIENVVFDVGQVLFEYDPGRIIDEVIGNTPYKDEYLESLFYAPLWQELDRGDVSQEEALSQLSNGSKGQSRKSEDYRALLNNYPYHLNLIEGTQNIFLTLHEQGYPLYILSNFQSEPFDKLINHHPFLNAVEGIVVSSKINMMKPEPAIYTHLLDTYSISPESTLFIDDLSENIDAAKEQGISGIVFETPEKLEADLSQFQFNLQ